MSADEPWLDCPTEPPGAAKPQTAGANGWGASASIESVRAAQQQGRPASEPQRDDRDKPAPSFDYLFWRQFQLDEDDHDLVGGLVEDRGLHYIVGAPGSAKTFFVLELAAHIAAGKPFLGREVRQAGVIYVAAERPDSVIQRSFALRKELGPSLPFVLIKSPVDLANGAWLNQLAMDLRTLIDEQMPDMPPRVLVIDTLASASPGLDENASGAMSKVIANMVELGKALNVAIICVHHTGKDTARGSRGHSSQLGRADAENIITRAESDGKKLNLFTVTVSKQRDGEDGTVIPFKLVVEPIGKTRTGKKIETCRIELLSEIPDGAKPDKPPRKLSRKALALQELHNLVVDIGEAIPMMKGVPMGVRGTTLERWKEHLVRMGAIENDPETVRKRFWDVCKELRTDQLIGINGEYVWASG